MKIFEEKNLYKIGIENYGQQIVNKRVRDI